MLNPSHSQQKLLKPFPRKISLETLNKKSKWFLQQLSRLKTQSKTFPRDIASVGFRCRTKLLFIFIIVRKGYPVLIASNQSVYFSTKYNDFRNSLKFYLKSALIHDFFHHNTHFTLHVVWSLTFIRSFFNDNTTMNSSEKI